MITCGQGTAGAAAVKLTVVPPGPGALLLSNQGTTSPVYVGMGTNLSSTNGFPIPASVVPVVIPLFAGSLGGQMYVVTAAGSANISWILTNATGQTGIGSLG